jgi:hypothetical protein
MIRRKLDYDENYYDNFESLKTMDRLKGLRYYSADLKKKAGLGYFSADVAKNSGLDLKKDG